MFERSISPTHLETNINNVFILQDLSMFNSKHCTFGCSKIFRFIETKAKYKKNKTCVIATKQEI